MNLKKCSSQKKAGGMTQNMGSEVTPSIVKQKKAWEYLFPVDL
jgi:hypothetical protein